MELLGLAIAAAGLGAGIVAWLRPRRPVGGTVRWELAGRAASDDLVVVNTGELMAQDVHLDVEGSVTLRGPRAHGDVSPGGRVRVLASVHWHRTAAPTLIISWGPAGKRVSWRSPIA